MQGWIKLHRELFETDLWHDVSTFRLFIYLISQASHRDGIKTKGIELKRGQYIRSYRKLADDLSYKEGRGYKKYSLSTIKSCVNKLIESERVNVQETEVGTLFTIVNYAKYQDSDGEAEGSPNTQSNEVRTNAELTPNEVRTNSEQEQELKNLRIKELNNISTATAARENYFDDYMLCFSGQPSPIQIQEINSFIDQDGLTVEVICAAFKKAAEVGAKYPYARSILNSWAKKGIKTTSDVENEQINHEQRKQQRRQNPRKGAIRTEMLPDWFNEQNNGPKDTPKKDGLELERKRAELQETLKKLRAGG